MLTGLGKQGQAEVGKRKSGLKQHTVNVNKCSMLSFNKTFHQY